MKASLRTAETRNPLPWSRCATPLQAAAAGGSAAPGRRPRRAKVQKRCTAPPPPRRTASIVQKSKKVHRPAVSGSGSNPRSRDGGVPRAPPRPGTRPARCPSAPRAGRANRARIAGCADNRPQCISRQENDRRCAENRPKCISWHGSAGTRCERTVRGRLLTSGETAGRTGAVIFLARWMERFGSGRRRRRAEIGVPENTLWPIFSTTAPSEPPENTLCPIFSTYCGQRGLGRAAAPTAPVRDARHGRNASWPNAVVVKTRVYWRVESRKIRLYGQNRPSLEVNAAERPRIPACESPAPVAAAAKPQFRRPCIEAWSKPAFSVPTVDASFDHGTPRPRTATHRTGDPPRPLPRGRPQVGRSRSQRPAARNLHQSPRAKARRPRTPTSRKR